MNIVDLFQETFFGISANKARSGLTILGIVIGIGSVIAMMSIGQGARGTIESTIQSIGSNLLTVMPGFQTSFSAVRSGRGQATTLTQDDADAIAREVPFVQAVASELSGRYQIVAKGKNTNTQVVGTVPSYPTVKNVELAEGLFISDQNIRNFSKVAVLGPTTCDDLFGEGAVAPGQTIKINKINFKVIGITKSKGGTGLMSMDDIIFIPLSTAQRFLAGSDYISTISVQAQSERVMSEVQTAISNLLLGRHNISDPLLADFSVISQADIVESASSIIDTLTILLASIAGISLIVGGIGIMNMMMTTVTERTREIGLRKAIGAKKIDISFQFLTEAIVLTFLGGAIGIIFGALFAYGITVFTGMATMVSLFSIILAFGVSAIIGIIFGYYPARKAANLNPIEALRYE